MGCDIAGGKQVGTLKFDAVDSSIVFQADDYFKRRPPMNMNSTFSAKWQGLACTESNK